MSLKTNTVACALLAVFVNEKKISAPHLTGMTIHGVEPARDCNDNV